MRIRSRLSRFSADKKGNVAVMSAGGVALFAGVAALVIDYGNGSMQKQRIQNALDAAAMAAAYNVGASNAFDLGITAYQKQVPPGSSLGTIDRSAFEVGVWNEKTKTFTPGVQKTMLYMVGTKPVYYNAVRVKVGAGGSGTGTAATTSGTSTSTTPSGSTGGTAVTGGATSNPYVRTFFGGLFGVNKLDISASAIAYVPPTSCVNITNVGDPWRHGTIPASSDYSNFRMFKDGIDFILMFSANSSWNACGYWTTFDDGTAGYNAPSVGTYAVTSSGDVAQTWANGNWGDNRIAKLAWNPIAVPDDFLAPYRTSLCTYNNTVIRAQTHKLIGNACTL